MAAFCDAGPHAPPATGPPPLGTPAGGPAPELWVSMFSTYRVSLSTVISCCLFLTFVRMVPYSAHCFGSSLCFGKIAHLQDLSALRFK